MKHVGSVVKASGTSCYENVRRRLFPGPLCLERGEEVGYFWKK